MEILTLDEVLTAVGGEVVLKGSFKEFNEVSTDSRKIGENSIFVALCGENFNGNKYANIAIKSGARLCIVDEDIEILKDYDYSIIKVENGKEALLKLAEYYRKKLSIKVIGVTGSTGKTSTKDLIAAILSKKFKVFKTKGNFNNEIGVPLMIFSLDKSYEVAVLEMGMSDFGEIHNLAKAARPDMAVITNIGLSHIENLGSKDGILKAKMEIVDFFNRDNTLILNSEDGFLRKVKSDDYKIITCGLKDNCKLKAFNIKLNEESIEFKVDVHGNSEGDKFIIDVPGEHNVLNSLLAISCAMELGVSKEEMIEGLDTLSRTSMRLDIIRSEKGYIVINDCYNASPQSMISALNVQKNINSKRRIATLGTMLELGGEAFNAHKEVGAYAKELGVNLYVTGDFAEAYKEGYGEDIKVFEEKAQLIDYIKNNTIAGDCVLVKASRGMKFEEVVEALK